MPNPSQSPALDLAAKAPRRPLRRRVTPRSESQSIRHHWREAVPEDRFAHSVRDATRSFQRSLQTRLADHDVPFGHWTFLRVLWEHDGLTQKQLSDEVGVMEPTTFAAVKAGQSRDGKARVAGHHLPTGAGMSVVKHAHFTGSFGPLAFC